VTKDHAMAFLTRLWSVVWSGFGTWAYRDSQGRTAWKSLCPSNPCKECVQCCMPMITYLVRLSLLNGFYQCGDILKRIFTVALHVEMDTMAKANDAYNAEVRAK
jgi:hypothetical protein